MVDEEEFKRLKRELDNLRKDKIIVHAKLKQKEDIITELSKKVQDISIEKSDSEPSDELTRKLKELTEDLTRSRTINKKLRSENAALAKQLEDAQKQLASGSAPTPSIQKITAPSSGVSNEEVEKLKAELIRKEEIISSLNDELDSVAQGGGGSFTKIRQLNAKIRELKSQLDLVKRSESEMKDRLIAMNRKVTSDKMDDFW